MNTRRQFIQKSVLGISVATLPGLSSGWTEPVDMHPEARASESFNLGIAGYSFLHFDLDASLAMMKRMDVHYLSIKDFHLPLDSTPEAITAFHQKLKAFDVTGYAVGPIYMTKSRTEIDAGFEYARRVGVKLIIGVPNKEDLEYISEKTKAYDIRYAIHNHGPEDKLYPNAKSVYDLIRNLDNRMGLCFDMGHDTRDGQDPVADLERYHSRIFDIHFKNVTAATRDGKTCELGRGVIDIPAFVAMLRKIKYTGQCSLEFEKDMKDPLPGLAESVGFYHGVVAALPRS